MHNFFTVHVRGHYSGHNPTKRGHARIFSVIMAANDAATAERVIDELCAHGHTLAGLAGGICADQCADIEGNDGNADDMLMYFTTRTDIALADMYDDDIQLVGGSAQHATAQEFAAAAIEHKQFTCDCRNCGETMQHCPDCTQGNDLPAQADCPTCDGEGNIPR